VTAACPDVASHTVSVEPAGVSFSARSDETILAAARRGGVWLPFECGWGSCGTCKLTLLEGRTRTLFDQAPCLRPQDRRRSRILACQSCPESDVVVETRRTLGQRADLPTADHQGTLVAVEQLAPDIRRLRFTVDRPVEFLPGQYALLEPEPGLRRAYSMTGLPGQRSVEFLVKRYEHGAGTKRLFELRPGAVVPIELPFGAAYYRSREQRPVFVAGGTGIAPIVSMLKGLAADSTSEAAGACVLYGARTIEELVLMDELETLCDTLQASLVPVLEQPPPGWTGSIGFVTDVIGGWLPAAWTELRYYVAGPPVMVEATLRLFYDAGVQVTRVHHDSFG
jgi:toluene monooxygenase electron transfer component